MNSHPYLTFIGAILIIPSVAYYAAAAVAAARSPKTSGEDPLLDLASAIPKK